MYNFILSLYFQTQRDVFYPKKIYIYIYLFVIISLKLPITVPHRQLGILYRYYASQIIKPSPVNL